MKHTLKITIILIGMFFIAQLIGIYVANAYLPQTVEVVINQTTGETINKTEYNLPYGLDPPENIKPGTSLISIITALFVAIVLMLLLMKLKAETFIKLWFLLVVIIGIAIALNSFFIGFKNSAILSLAIAMPLGVIKIFKRNIIVHNATELLIYPGIASVFIPILIDKNGWLVNKLSYIFPNITEINSINAFFSPWAVVLLLILISIYDIYAVWHAGFMQKMARYQIEKLRIFSGFFIPYIGRKERLLLKKLKKTKAKKLKGKGIGVHLAILGGGDVVFPMLLSGVVLSSLGLLQAIIIAIGATIALAYLFYISEKGKFYPAMPFISAGCLIALGVAYLL